MPKYEIINKVAESPTSIYFLARVVNNQRKDSIVEKEKKPAQIENAKPKSY